MTRSLRLALLAAFIVGCADHDPLNPLVETPAERAVSDGMHDGGNPLFFFLPPMVPQPPAGMLPGFEPGASPVVRIACLDSNQGGCDGFEPIVFEVGAGVTVEADHYKVEFDTRAHDGLETSGAGGFTTYRIRVEVSLSFEELGQFTFALGYADFQLGANGRDAKNVSSGEEHLIGLVDGRTLPIRFRVERGALALELKEATAELGDAAVCQVNCSVTFIDPDDEETLAFLEDAEVPGAIATAILFNEGDVVERSVLIIDARDEADCAPGTPLRKKNCYRYLIHPATVDSHDGHRFADDVRFGICPVGVPHGTGTQWALFRVSGATIERPHEIEVDDFLPCAHAFASAGGWSALNRLALAVFDWLVPPLYAGDCGAGRHDCWGGTIRDLSDLFWGLDAELSLVTDPAAGSIPEGSELTVTALVRGVHSHPAAPIAGMPVDFEVVEGAGELFPPVGVTPVSTTTSGDGRTVRMRLLTGAGGLATVRWKAGSGPQEMGIRSIEALAAGPDALAPIVSTAAGQGVIAFTSERDGDRQIYLVLEDGEGLTNLTDLPGTRNETPKWSPDGTRIAFASTRHVGGGEEQDLEVYVMDADGSNVVRLTSTGTLDRPHGWSPDGARLVISSDRSGERSVWVIDAADGGGAQLLAAGAGFGNFSPDGSKITFERFALHLDPNTGDSVPRLNTWIMDADGSNQVNMTTAIADHDARPAWAPDGGRIAITRHVPDQPLADIWIISATTAGLYLANLTGEPGLDPVSFNSHPAWHPDRPRIAFHSNRAGGAVDIYVMDDDGQNVQRVTFESGSFDGLASWRPRP